MKNGLLIFLFFCFINLHLFGQDQIKRLNFILLIDGEVPIETISDGYVILKENNGLTISKIPFSYKVGSLDFSLPDYEKIQTKLDKSNMMMEFKFLVRKPTFMRYFYETSIFLNEDYMIMNIYNKSKRENNEKYDFGKKKYIVRIESSSFNTIMHYRSDWYRKHKLELN